MRQEKSETERFDELFGRIERVPKADYVPDGWSEIERRLSTATKRTPEKILGDKVVGFVIFESRAWSESGEKPLYSPSITAFINRSEEAREIKHVKRRPLESVATENLGDVKKGDVMAELEQIEELFSEYEESA